METETLQEFIEESEFFKLEKPEKNTIQQVVITKEEAEIFNLPNEFFHYFQLERKVS